MADDEESASKTLRYDPNATGLFAEADLDSESDRLQEEEDDMLNEALMAFSVMANLPLTNEFPQIKLSADLEYLASVRWRQLLANWKHTEMIGVMTRRPSSMHFSDPFLYTVDHKTIWSSSASTTSVDHNVRKREKMLENSFLLLPSTKNRSGMAPSFPFGVRSLSRFTMHIGTVATDEPSAQQTFGSKIPKLVRSFCHGEPSVEKLLHLAGENHWRFSRLIEKLAVFASQDYHPGQVTGYDVDNVSFSVDIKDAAAVQRKAAIKYEGDLMQVKDILRAQVVFPTEGSLICALNFLNQYCSVSISQQRCKLVEELGLRVEIVRIKNLFAINSTGQPCPACLPTGYRHILVNVRLDERLIAGKLQLKHTSLP
jgi:hypothetical protein